MKKVISVLIASTILISSLFGFDLQVEANQSGDTITMVKEQAKDFKLNFEVEELLESQLLRYNEDINYELRNTEFFKNYDRSLFTEVKNKDLKNLKIYDDSSKLTTYFIYKAYESENELYFMQIVYCPEIEKVINYRSDKINKTNNDVKILDIKKDSLNKDKDFKAKIKVMDKNLSTRNSDGYFTFNGQSFLCSAGGVLACGTYCGALGLLSPAVGVGCSLACGLAFAAVCSIE